MREEEREGERERERERENESEVEKQADRMIIRDRTTNTVIGEKLVMDFVEREIRLMNVWAFLYIFFVGYNKQASA